MSAAATVRIAMPERKTKPVRAYPVAGSPGLVVTPGVVDFAGAYVVTHVATGKRLPGAWTLPEAVVYARRLAPLCDWTARKPAVDTCAYCHADDTAFRTCEGCYGLAAVPKGGAR